MIEMLQIVGLISSVVIFLRVEPALNLMNHECRLPVRAALWLLAIGAAGLVLMITQGYVPTLPVALSLVGIALLLTCERRLHGIFNRKAVS